MSGDPGIDSDDVNDIIFTPDPYRLPGPTPGTTHDGIKLPSLPTTSYSYDPIMYTYNIDHKANGSFRETFKRGDRDLNSVLIGGYIKCEGPNDEEISGKLGGGRQSNSDNGKAGRCYVISIRIGGSGIRIRKENPHSSYHETGISVSLSLGDRSNHYTGVMFMKVNQTINGKDCVRCLCWIDTAGMNDSGVFTAGSQNWVKVLDATDTGNWHDGIWLTTATPGDSRATIRTDQQADSSYDTKLLFCARIKGHSATY